MINKLLSFSISMLILYLISPLYTNMFTPILCEEFTQDDQYVTAVPWGTNIWRIFFKNVNVVYDVAKLDRPINSSGHYSYSFQEIDTGFVPGFPQHVPLNSYVRSCHSVLYAVWLHNYQINCELLHPNLHNNFQGPLDANLLKLRKDAPDPSVFVRNDIVFFIAGTYTIKYINTIKNFIRIININIVKIILALLYIVVSVFTFKQFDVSILVCDCNADNVQDNIFYRIVPKGSNSWEVFFKNVNVKYQVASSSEQDGELQNIRFKETGLNTNLVDHSRTNTNVTDAVMEHFNDIQRGEFHPDHFNYLNSNPHGKNIKSPLDQFEIKSLLSIYAPIFGNLHISLTNIALYLGISAYITLSVSFISSNYSKIIAHNWSISQESIYATIHSIVINQINEKNGQKYYPFMYCLFVIILSSNLIGMVPYSFASTSHFVLTFFLSFTIVLGSTILGFLLHKLEFFSLFVPSGCPLGLLFLLVLIEFISYLARNVSLGLRLAANILSGHMLLNILSEFTYKIMETNILYFFIGIIPLMFIIAFSALELGIAFIQSQVFVVLSSSYVKDSLELH